MTIIDKLKLCRQILTMKEEDRCPSCKEGDDCPEFNTWVPRPCPYYWPKRDMIK